MLIFATFDESNRIFASVATEKYIHLHLEFYYTQLVEFFAAKLSVFLVQVNFCQCNYVDGEVLNTIVGNKYY